MDRDEPDAFDSNPLLALANFLLVNIRAILFFFGDNKNTNLNQFVPWLHEQGFRFSQSVARGFHQLRDAQLVSELNNYVRGLLHFSTRNRGQVQYINHSLGDGGLMDVFERDVLPLHLKDQVEENVNALTERLKQLRTNADQDSSTSEDTVQPSFEEEMESRLNSSATHVGPVRQIGRCFGRPEVTELHEGNTEAQSSSSSEFGFPPIQEFSQRSSEVRTVPQHPLPAAPESDDDLESFSDSWIGDTQDGDTKEEEQRLGISSLSIEQPSTSQQAYSQPIETDEQASTSQKGPPSQTHSQNYFVSETHFEPQPIDSKQELFQKVQQAIGKNENNDANARRIMDKLGVTPAENKFSTDDDYQGSFSVNACASMVSEGIGASATAVTHSNPFHMSLWGHYHPLADNYSNNLNMESCSICQHLIYADHEVLPCGRCYLRYHAKCLAYSAHRRELCRSCESLLRSDRHPYQ